MEVDEKKIFRKQMLVKRDAIPFEQRRLADKERNEKIRCWDVYRSAELVLFSVSSRSEADTLELLKEALSEGRNIAVPKVTGSEMFFYRITEISQLVEGYKGILEPDTERTEAVTFLEKTILFVPGCAFDEKGGRMGYGGGFYDRFMEQYPDVLRVALAYEEQLVEAVPREAHDKPVHVIVTETRMMQVKNT